jgi:type II secretory pathway component PulF
MPTFTYQAKQGPANVVQGTLQAQSREEAVTRLLQEGLVPVSILIRAEDLPAAAAGPRRVRVRAKDQRLFTRQLTSLLRAKVELVAAVAILKDQCAAGGMRLLLDDLDRHMRDGNSFSDALARHPRVFPPLFLSGIRAGEAAGKLDAVLLKLVEFGEQQELLESRLKTALAYPLLLLLLGMGSLVFFIWIVVPRMTGLFVQLGGALPWPTKVLIALSEGLSHSWLWVLASGLGAGVLVSRLRRLPVVVAATERVLMWLPVMRDLLQARQASRFTRTLQLLLDSGLPVFQAMDVARPTLGSALMERRMQEAQELVKRGGSVAESLRAANCFPPLVTHMVAVGESGGTLVAVLDELALYYERFLDESLRILTALLEPLMIVLMGVLVGFCVLAMILPVFQMTQLVQ